MTIEPPKRAIDNWVNAIDDRGVIAGYYGIFESPREPAQSYLLTAPYGPHDYHYAKNRQGLVYASVASSHSDSTIAGYFPGARGAIYGFIEHGDLWSTYRDPRLRKGQAGTTELLGITIYGNAVGYYSDGRVDRSILLRVGSGKFETLTPPGAVSSESTGISVDGDIVGFLTTSSGVTRGYFVSGRNVVEFSAPYATNTQAWGINSQKQIVGSYEDAKGSTHGFLLTRLAKHPVWETIDWPKGNGFTVLRGINDRGDFVGDYKNDAGRTNAFVCGIEEP